MLVVQTTHPSSKCRVVSEGLQQPSAQLWLSMSYQRLVWNMAGHRPHELSLKPYQALLCQGPDFGETVKHYVKPPEVKPFVFVPTVGRF